jgi:protein O-GlcNAc transferase
VLWAQVMKAVENSRLILIADEGSHRQRTIDRLVQEGIDADRVEFVPYCPRGPYLKYYQRIDVGLDTIPYNGHTTSLDSYWMGVPVITLIGNTAVGRAGFSQLNNLGMAVMAARSPERYVQLTSKMAANLPQLAKLRGALRQRLQKSPLCDAKRFARNIESAYRQMWEQWTAGS